MRSFFQALLFVVALLFSQHAAVLHGLAHAEHEVALAEHGEGKAPALGHGLDECAAYFALAHALGNAAVAPRFAGVALGPAIVALEAPATATRIVFDSRAPPLSA